MHTSKSNTRRHRFLVEWLFMLMALLMLGGTIVYSQYRENLTFEVQQFIFLVLVSGFCLLIHQRHQRKVATLAESQEQLLRTCEAKLHSFFDATPDALLISDAQGIITMTNHQAELLLGYSEQELVGMSIDELVPRRARQHHPAQRTAFTATPNARRMGYGLAVQTRRKDGSECDVEVSLSRIETEEGLFFASALRDITERNRAQEQQRIAAVAFESHQGVVVTDANDIILRVNQAFTKITGYTAQESVGRNMNFLKSDRHDDAFWRHVWRTILDDGSWEGEIWNKNKNAEIHPHWLTIAAVKDSKAVISHFIGTYTDITEIKKAEADLRVAAVAFESNQAMMITDSNNTILRINRTFTEITGYALQDVIGKNPRIFKSGTHDVEFYRSMWHSINTTGVWNGEIWDKRKNGELYPKWMTISAVKDGSGKVTHYIGSHFDISERKKSEEIINSLAFFDQLTGLPNRTLLIDRLKQTMAASARTGHHCALLFIDLDNFKSLNDTLGHDMGDLLLKQVAQRLSQCGREGDTVARLGGDEFVVVLANLGECLADAALATETVAQKFLDALYQSYLLRDVSHRSTASIGATVFLGQEISVDELMKQADLAMYRSKDNGRNALHFFDSSMELAVKKRVALEADLRHAVLTGQFLLHYQAQITHDGHVIGAEVLLRWQHPVHGMVSPAEFIPLAEETGLILPIGLWVLKKACDQLAQWAQEPDLAHLSIAVNVSVHQFNDFHFVRDVLALLSASKANPQQLKLELTESLMAGKMQDIIRKMNLLKEQGMKFSLDDFGTGYSSLSYLNRLPLDQLKIDQSFVRDVLTDRNDAVIARSIVALGQSLGLNVIAEGVETQEQRAFLAQSGCLVYQGYLFSRPVPVKDFVELVRQSETCMV
jgi:diguanylate cyclase (GGDEF)-like protein/PAS domain S-box-containing protein